MPVAHRHVDARPGIVVAPATAGDLLQWHPHLHVITTDAGRAPDGSWHLLKHWDGVRLVYLDGQQAVLYRSRMNPSLGRNFEAMDPLEWLAHMSDHIPDPGQHRTLFYGEYSSRVRGMAQALLAEPAGTSAEPPPRRRCPQAGPG